MTFTPNIYAAIRDGCIRSAERIVPAVMDLLYPKTVVDVGCGEGWFAREFAKHGCGVYGVDESVEPGVEGYGDGMVRFFQGDILEPSVLPGSSFDLAVCLEVAEHLPEAASDALVAVLAASAPMVLWSAAVPGQGGHGHVNCQWPGYWDERFAEHGFACCDTLRWMFWDDDAVEVWYRQNMLLYADTSAEVHGRHLAFKPPVAVVHPDMWAWKL